MQVASNLLTSTKSEESAWRQALRKKNPPALLQGKRLSDKRKGPHLCESLFRRGNVVGED